MKVKIGDKIYELDDNAIIKCTSKEIKHKDGRIDCEVHVPSLKIQSTVQEIK